MSRKTSCKVEIRFSSKKFLKLKKCFFGSLDKKMIMQILKKFENKYSQFVFMINICDFEYPLFLLTNVLEVNRNKLKRCLGCLKSKKISHIA